MKEISQSKNEEKTKLLDRLKNPKDRRWKTVIDSIKEMFIVMCIAMIVGCPFKRILGVSCPACGMTRAFVRAFQLNFKKAFYYHPLFITVPFIILIFAFRDFLPKKVTNACLILFIVGFVAVYLYRIFVLHSPVLTFDITDSYVYQFLHFLYGKLAS